MQEGFPSSFRAKLLGTSQKKYYIEPIEYTKSAVFWFLGLHLL